MENMTRHHSLHLIENLVLSGGTSDPQCRHSKDQNQERGHGEDRIKRESRTQPRGFMIIPIRERPTKHRPKILEAHLICIFVAACHQRRIG
jgi:hypothetical protein